MSAPAILDPRRAWLARRRELITASDAAAILGADDHGRSAYRVWAEKVGDLELQDTVDMARGRRFEKVIGEEYRDQMVRPIAEKADPYEIAVHPDLGWLAATLDMTTSRDDDWERPSAEWVPLQIKYAPGSANQWRDGAPTGYLVQCQVEAACVGAAWSALCGLVGPGPLRTFDLERDDAFLALALPKLERFHWHVQTRTPPEADGSESTTAALRALYRVDDGETVDLGADGQAEADSWDAHELLAEAEAEQATAAKNKLKALMGAATFARLADGSYLEWKANRAGRRRFRRFWPRRR